MSSVGLVCPVRSCGRPLTRMGRAWTCGQGHAFDIARSGYCNLLQPQDRRSSRPGDSKAAISSRRRSLARGTGDALRDVLVREVSSLGLDDRAALLDAGCGDGFFTMSMAGACNLEGWGVDLSTCAVDAAARRWPDARWIVANADRRLPFADGSFDLLTTITGPKHAAEFHRLLKPGGWLIVVVPGTDDLAELRAAVLGQATPTGRAARSRELFSAHFDEVAATQSRASIHLDHDGLVDLFAGAYRGLRTRERARLDTLVELDVTVHHDVLVMRRR
jgi:23S rRNA (guanine745-N1)-methyltransferase